MFVYSLQSLSHSDKFYIGCTEDVEARLEKHNKGDSPHTSKYRPWKMVAYLWFEDEKKALTFEKYLKSGSGRAFSKKHF